MALAQHRHPAASLELQQGLEGWPRPTTMHSPSRPSLDLSALMHLEQQL